MVASRRTPNLPFEWEPLTVCVCVLWHMTTFEQEKKNKKKKQELLC